MDGWVDGWLGGWMDRWMDRWMNGNCTQTEGWTNPVVLEQYLTSVLSPPWGDGPQAWVSPHQHHWQLHLSPSLPLWSFQIVPLCLSAKSQPCMLCQAQKLPIGELPWEWE